MDQRSAEQVLRQRQQTIVAEFSSLQDWQDRYKKIIALGKNLPALAEELKTDEAKVKGCQSQVWLHARLDENKNVIFQADSDAMIVRGLVALLLRVYSSAPPQAILKVNPDFISQLGFENHLSPSRANGLQAMVRQIKYFALAFQAVLAKKT